MLAASPSRVVPRRSTSALPNMAETCPLRKLWSLMRCSLPAKKADMLRSDVPAAPVAFCGRGAPRASSSAAEENECAQDEQEYRPQYPDAHVQNVERSEEEYHAGDYESCAHDPGTGVHQEVRNADDHKNCRPRFVEWECDQVVNKEQASDDK